MQQRFDGLERLSSAVRSNPGDISSSRHCFNQIPTHTKNKFPLTAELLAPENSRLTKPQQDCILCELEKVQADIRNKMVLTGTLFSAIVIGQQFEQHRIIWDEIKEAKNLVNSTGNQVKAVERAVAELKKDVLEIQGLSTKT